MQLSVRRSQPMMHLLVSAVFSVVCAVNRIDQHLEAQSVGTVEAPLLPSSASVVSTAADHGEDTAPLLSMCSVDAKTAAVRCVNRSLVEIPANLPPNAKSLNLSCNRITRVSAQAIGHLSYIEVISLRNNRLTAIFSDSFVNCSALRTLYLDHNMLSSLRFVQMTNLRELHMSHNLVTMLDTGNTVLSLTTVDLSFNSLRQFSGSVLSRLQNVRVLNVSHNVIESVSFDDSSVLSHLRHLDISGNRLATLSLCSGCYSYSLQYVDVSSNRIHVVDSSWCELWPNLTVLIASRNPVTCLMPGTFRHCTSLHTLHLSSLLIQNIDAGVLKGVTHLRTLRLDLNKRLVSLHRDLFEDLRQLVELDLRGCSLTALEPPLPLSLSVVRLGNNPWLCDCEAVMLRDLSMLSSRGLLVSNDTECVGPASVAGRNVLNVSLERDECRSAQPHALRQTVWAQIGTDLVVDCNATGDRPLNTTWFSKHDGHIVPVGHAAAAADNFELGRTAPQVMHTGSLYIGSVSRATAGLYYCTVSNDFGSGTMVLSVRLNSDAISLTTLHSIIVGLLSSAGFFLVAVVIGIVRYLAYLCSTKERRKRKSIRAVLESIQDYKCAQFDRFSAYRTAKMDQLSAFKSAKIEQLSAFRDARVDRLRTYKQATVASILTHIERMREHYAAQTARIKDNCAQQAERLRQRYTSRCGRFKNYRSHQVDRMRENYALQAARIREYGLIQMSRLREQYKAQQQHVLKLVELLDVGSCVSGVIEAECMKAESMIFDADIAFDFEAQPAHANESLMIGAAPDASDSDLSMCSSDEYSVTCVADVVSIPAAAADGDVAGAVAMLTTDRRDVVMGMVAADNGSGSQEDEMRAVLAVADDVLHQLQQVTDVQLAIGVHSSTQTTTSEGTSSPKAAPKNSRGTSVDVVDSAVTSELVYDTAV